MNRNRTDEALKEYTENHLSALHPDNLAVARKLLVRRLNKANQWSSNHTWAQALKHMDIAIGHRPFVSVSPDDWAHIIQEGLVGKSRDTMNNRASFIREFLRKALACKDLPLDLEDALTVGLDKEETLKSRIITEDERRMLLEQIVDHPLRYDSSRTIAEKTALQWHYDDTGYRADEGRSLTIGEWARGHFDDNGQRRQDGGVKLKLCSRKQAIQRGCRLKRGPREIVVYKSVAVTDVWFEEHPAGGNLEAPEDPEAPLWTGFHDKTGRRRLSKQMLNNWVRRLGLDAGLSPIEGRKSPLIPHDFRHTRITTAAKQRPFNFPEFSMYFWGIPDSKEAATYVHLKGDDLTAVARSNMGIDQYGYHVPAVDLGASDLLARVMALQTEVDRLRRSLDRPAP